ncbi:valine--tRNA ligase [Bifidobacterium gallicum]|uniref:Valine--tRNA ligase n=1 Tax=Bifidobacterium gallicum DSM 20093 = LMG 11596 TaxID=561180 RepID=D1NWW2_9BIFI|nr:valine--tRNA ligase [Bifidobacterium gallicum]EFA22093.1 valine--tRNA ligase [Bifidobacterium gallicum DSM 20093 = LMG 11596]KFI59038.1 valyl-tRNA synthetase [Bifidobacterium gallicum DSM 20093 = LMG 11596]
MTDSRNISISANLTALPDRVSVDGLETKWGEEWETDQTYAFHDSRDRDAVYSIDTPPPTVSGSLHVGHVFSYTHTDIIARFKRMNGFDVFYPMGWDDNGLPTERRVQNYYGVRVDTSLKYDPDFVPPFEGTEGKKIQAKDQVPISRKNFIELCEKLTAQDEKLFEALWRKLGLSVDWKQTYHTIGQHPQRVAQKAFLRNLARGQAYQKEAPGLWDVTFQTAVAQAELESREYPGFYHKVAFHFEDGSPIYIETTRPELLPACVALIAHPDDERYQQYFGQFVYSPLFGVKVPVLAHPAAEKDKGAGIAMCCTFGDMTDVEWWRDLHLPTRSIIQRNGRIIMDMPDWITSEEGKRIFGEIEGKTTFSARKIIVDALRESGDLDGEPKPTQRMTNFYEKGDKPLEIVTSRQWYLENGGTNPELNAKLIERGKELNFHPDFMRVRYENWVHGLNGDWLISRQRFFGVPFPLWYPLDANGQPDYEHPLTPSEDILPIDPTSDVPEGYTEDQRDQPNGFTAEKDIMDTWATSSLTPQIVTHWAEPGEANEALFHATFPMDLRPQGQDIIRTWLFSSVDRAQLENNCLPWANAALSGWILDPDHKKMSKSKGNVVVPNEPIEKYGADAVRYWAACARLGLDATYDEGQMKIGRRLAIKLLNATKFALAIGREDENHHVADAASTVWNPEDVTEPLDRAAMAKMALVIREATLFLENYEHSKALEVIESYFWQFCDDYIELVKNRAYGTEDAHGNKPTEAAIKSARTALGMGLDAFARLLAPFLPYATEEVWSWMHAGEGSVHRAAWPKPLPYATAAFQVSPDLLANAGQALAALRGIKSKSKVSMKTPIKSVTLAVDPQVRESIKAALGDIAQAGRVIGDFSLENASTVIDRLQSEGPLPAVSDAVEQVSNAASSALDTVANAAAGLVGVATSAVTGNNAASAGNDSTGSAETVITVTASELGEPPAKKPKN